MNAIDTVKAALPGAEVRSLDWGTSIGVMQNGKAWLGDCMNGFIIDDAAHVQKLIDIVKTDRQRIA